MAVGRPESVRCLDVSYNLTCLAGTGWQRLVLGWIRSHLTCYIISTTIPGKITYSYHYIWWSVIYLLKLVVTYIYHSSNFAIARGSTTKRVALPRGAPPRSPGHARRLHDLRVAGAAVSAARCAVSAVAFQRSGSSADMERAGAGDEPWLFTKCFLIMKHLQLQNQCDHLSIHQVFLYHEASCLLPIESCQECVTGTIHI